MRARRILALLTLVLFLLPALASAGERSRREILPQFDLAQIREILVRPWLLLWRAPQPEVNKGGGTMDPDGLTAPTESDD
ncbi:MAG TPA: hypothetical protein VLE27_02800 [Thermoanaerobaculia bacterium]|nr:hypothetical protein [Thermoanaerobaculia bacterium]